MAKKQQVDTSLQLPMDLLFDQLNEQQGQPIEWPVPPEDIGSELLSILSKGLYPSPLDCIREYVQNSVDAEAKVVTVKITGNSVLISDDGTGMNLENLVEARKFGVSPKSMFQNVGFRGIGLYSGFDICDRLIITTKSAKEANSYVLKFDFKAMRAQLDIERKEARKERTPVNQLIQKHSHFQLELENTQNHYTIVQLENLSNAHIDQLADREKLRKYMLRNLPIDFDDKFTYKNKISDELRKNVQGYNAIIIKLETDTSDREIITRPVIPNLGELKLGTIYNAKKEAIAYYWACLYLGEDTEYGKKGTKIPDKYEEYRGFVYKVKGFTIGDNRILDKWFKRGSATLYDWYTGEIFVLDNNVIPNAARDNFESSSAKTQLDLALQDLLLELDKEADKYREQLLADRKAKEGENNLKELEQKISDGHYNPSAVYHEISNIVAELDKRQKNVTDPSFIKQLKNRAEELSRTIRRDVNQPQELSGYNVKKKRKTQKSPQSQPSLFIAEAKPTKTLVQLLEELSWEVSDDCKYLIQAIDESLETVLGRTSFNYSRIMDDIESKLIREELE